MGCWKACPARVATSSTTTFRKSPRPSPAPAASCWACKAPWTSSAVHYRNQGADYGRILVGLQGALDFERGGDLATNLNELYSYITRRLFHVNAHNDVAVLDEIYGLMQEIRDAWEGVPALLPVSNRSVGLVN